jgi:chaperone required for assembly of F1-ATPase
MVKPLPRRFYSDVATAPAMGAEGFAVLLDGRQAKTPGKAVLCVPTAALARAIAGEWAAQDTVINPAAMPHTRLANTAIDAVAARRDDVRADLLKYADSDLLCYRADAPAGLVQRQAATWDPVLRWLHATTGAHLLLSTGIRHVTQQPAALQAIAEGFDRVVPADDPFRLAAAHVMTTLTGSAVLAMAVLARELSAEAAWTAAHIDEDWQIAQWGEDWEAAERRKRRWAEMQAAALLVALLEQ